MTDSKDYSGDMNRRSIDKVEENHRRITEQNTHAISLLNSDINGVKVSLTNIDRSVVGIGKKLDAVTADQDVNWPAIGSLIVGVILVFGAIFGFLFQTQSGSVQDQLTAVQRESDLRHEIRDLHERNLTQQVVRLQDRVLRKLEVQEQLNLDLVRDQTEDSER